MLLKVGIGLVVLVAGFCVYVSTRTASFRYERSGLINASPEKVFPYISDLRMGEHWSPYEKKDSSLKKTFTGDGRSVGSIMDFKGGKESGSGSIEILNTVPNERTDYRLTMTEPFRAVNMVEYSLKPEGTGTRFTWVMHGDNNFIGKLVSVLIDCEKMIGGDFEKGIANLKQVVEKQG